MATSVIYNGVTYSVPSFNDVGYAQGPGNLSQYLVALATAQPSGAPFPNNVSFTSPFGIVGVTTNSNATAGNVGEYVESIVSAVMASASGSYSDATTISLTAGDWDVTLQALGDPSASSAAIWEIGISKGAAGNSFTDRIVGSNMSNVNIVAANTESMNVAEYRVSLAVTTTIRAKSLWTYAGAAPLVSGRLSARRIR
jgi:uncharacterized alpha/beta hydrolase family protein